MPNVSEDSALMNLRSSRLGFIVEYACATFIFAGFLVLAMKGKSPIFPIKVLGFGIGIIAIASAEIARAITRYTISEAKLTIVTGIVKQTRKHVYFHPLGFVPDLNVNQGRINRMLGIGTVYLKAGGGENTFEIKDVQHPHRVLKLIEELIDSNKSNPSKSIEKHN
jgi:membrane protein YdbS with pleckstrin-like domain